MNVNAYYTLAWNVNKFHYGIYAYTECKSQPIYMYNTGIDQWCEDLQFALLKWGVQG
jgi:hypothetical protein